MRVLVVNAGSSSLKLRLVEEGARVAVAHRGIFAGRDPIALEIGRMTLAIRRSHARAMTVAPR